jgi:hypothetical protein
MTFGVLLSIASWIAVAAVVSPNLNAFALALAAIVVCALAMVAEAIPA